MNDKPIQSGGVGGVTYGEGETNAGSNASLAALDAGAAARIEALRSQGFDVSWAKAAPAPGPVPTVSTTIPAPGAPVPDANAKPPFDHHRGVSATTEQVMLDAMAPMKAADFA